MPPSNPSRPSSIMTASRNPSRGSIAGSSSHEDPFTGRPLNSAPSSSSYDQDQDLQHLSVNPLRFLGYPRDTDDDDEQGPPRLSSTSMFTPSVPTSPHTTDSYRRTLSSTFPSNSNTTTNNQNNNNSNNHSSHYYSRDMYSTPSATPTTSKNKNYGTLNSSNNAHTQSSGGKSITDLMTKSQKHKRQVSMDNSKLNGIFKTLSRKPSRAMSWRSTEGHGFEGGEGEGEQMPMLGSRISAREVAEEEVRKEEEESPTGLRLWYSSYITIDWLHDQIKDSHRLDRLRSRAKRSIRGAIINSWDRVVGWLVVSVIGILTALVAYGIVKSEGLLFDYKNGYCSTSLLSTKKDCCLEAMSTKGGRCLDWVNWDEVVGERVPEVFKDMGWGWIGAFGVYLGIALLYSITSSCLTVYLTSSTSFASYEQNHSPFLPEKTSKSPTASSFNPVTKPPPAVYFAAGSGIPEIKVIMGGFVIHGYLGARVLIVKAVGLALSVASGLSLGKEGPIVQISSGIGNIVSRQFSKYEKNEAKRREILSAAAAAGVAVAFGAPIGGVLFSLEEVSTYFSARTMWRSFFCASIAALFLRFLNPYGNGKLVLLEVQYTKDYHHESLYLAAIALGLLGGIYGALWSRLNIVYTKRVRKGTWLARHPIVEVGLVCTATACLAYSSRYLRVGGVEFVAEMFSECLPGSSHHLCPTTQEGQLEAIRELVVSFFVRAGITAATFGLALPAGIFVPSLAAGACFGRILALSLQAISDTSVVVPGVYALIGAASALAGVTRTTISLCVIVVELTGNIEYAVPVALSILVAKTFADAIESDGIYDLVINAKQLPYLDPKIEYRFKSLTVANVVVTSLPVLKVEVEHTVSRLKHILADAISFIGSVDGSIACVFEYEMDDEYALGISGILNLNELRGTVEFLQNEPEAVCRLQPSEVSRLNRSPTMISSVYSYAESAAADDGDPYDLMPLVDKAPLTILIDSPLELLHQMFTRLGARTVVVIDKKGRYHGLVLKKGWLKFLKELEEGRVAH